MVTYSIKKIYEETYLVRHNGGISLLKLFGKAFDF